MTASNQPLNNAPVLLLRNHTPRKRFGQHFLTDAGVIDAIVAAIAPQPDDLMVEIGPGLGALTHPVSQRLRHLHAVEIDRDVIARLRKTFTAAQLTIHAADALAFDFGRLAAPGRTDTHAAAPRVESGTASTPGHTMKTLGASASPGHDPGAANPDTVNQSTVNQSTGGPRTLRVIGNLPYNISTPLLFHLADYIACLHDIHVMLQKEVVERMVAEPDTAAYGRLSVALQYRFEMEKVLDVGPDAFYPQPKVDSAVVRMTPRKTRVPAAIDEALFASITTTAFSQRRKTLRNTLRNFLTAADFEALSIDPGARAETLSVSDFVHIANRLSLKA